MSDTPIRRRNGAISDARVNDAKTQSQYQPYKDAAWGFINHWYPALFSKELEEGAVEGIQICGVQIALRRSKGKIYALKDQCLHRGVRLSAKPMCLTEDTLTCWYHGFTFNLDDGKLTTIAGNPDDKLIGTTGLTTYPVEEVAGMIFVFVREDDYPDEDVPPLAHDLPLSFPENSERFPTLCGPLLRACWIKISWPTGCIVPATPTGELPVKTASTMRTFWFTKTMRLSMQRLGVTAGNCPHGR